MNHQRDKAKRNHDLHDVFDLGVLHDLLVAGLAHVQQLATKWEDSIVVTANLSVFRSTALENTRNLQRDLCKMRTTHVFTHHTQATDSQRLG